MDEKKLTFLKDYRNLKKEALRNLNPSKSIARGNKQVPYADLTDYIVLINSIIDNFNFFCIERIVDNQNGFETIYMKLVHENGEETPESSKAIHVNENMQTNGSAQTYARRYLFMVLLGIHGEADDDGQSTVKIDPKKIVKIDAKDVAMLKKLALDLGYERPDEALAWLARKGNLARIEDMEKCDLAEAIKILEKG